MPRIVALYPSSDRLSLFNFTSFLFKTVPEACSLLAGLKVSVRGPTISQTFIPAHFNFIPLRIVPERGTGATINSIDLKSASTYDILENYAIRVNFPTTNSNMVVKHMEIEFRRLTDLFAFRCFLDQVIRHQQQRERKSDTEDLAVRMKKAPPKASKVPPKPVGSPKSVQHPEPRQGEPQKIPPKAAMSLKVVLPKHTITPKHRGAELKKKEKGPPPGKTTSGKGTFAPKTNRLGI